MDVQYAFGQPEQRQSAVIAVSAFDGVHRGHQRLLGKTVALAQQQGLMPVALLPWPPSSDEAGADGIVTTLSERLALIERLAPEVQVIVLPAGATQPWSTTTLLARITSGWDVVALVVDATSQEPRCGTELAEEAARGGVPIRVLGDATDPANCLDVRIRSVIRAGNVAEAAELLTYEYKLHAEVVGGDRRGRLLGFPTANLRVDAGKIIPANGIYAVRVGLPGDSDVQRPAVASVGVRPTFGDHNARLVEVHLLDISIDLYGTRIETAFVEWLRSEERFESVEALIAQMSTDVEQARRRLALSK